MTREEAIQRLKTTDACDVDLCEALDMAIKALEQEPCEDAVSRQAVLEVMKKCHCEEWVKADIGAPIEALQSVTPQQKVGKWIKYCVQRCGEQHYKCTACGYYVNFGQWGELYTREFKYCPNCGAKMSEIPTGAEGSDKE